MARLVAAAHGEPRRRSVRSPASILAASLAAAACAWLVHDAFIVGRATPTRRQLGVACNAVDPKLKGRIASIKKTGKLTDAMRMVAAAKVRRAQDGVEKSRPFSEELQGMIKGLVKKLKGTGLEAELPMLRVAETVKSVGIVLVTSNRGLCGGYNTLIMKRMAARVKDLSDQGIEPKIVIVGNKGLNQLARRCEGSNYNNTGTFFGMPDRITAKIAGDIADEVRNLFLSGEVDKVEIVYAKFVNLLKSDATVKTLLPLTPTGIEDPEDLTFKLTSVDGKLAAETGKATKVKAKNIENDVIFDQAPETILNSMLPLYLSSQILSILFEAQASELGSRMTAMKAATDNAEELAKKLTTLYNKKRQAAITQEICELSSAAVALEEKKDSRGGPALGFEDTEESITEEFLSDIAAASVPDQPLEPEDKYAADLALA